jgi:hypothetical protein
MHAKGYPKQCTDEPLGTYFVSVPTFVSGYMYDLKQQMQDKGMGDDYTAPSVATYIDCTPFVINNQQFYLQLGCADKTTQALAVNIYTDSSCTQRSVVNGYDDSTIDVSAIEVSSGVGFLCVVGR